MRTWRHKCSVWVARRHTCSRRGLCLDDLPLELLLRRLQSSCVVNPARSLHAHFTDVYDAAVPLRDALSARLHTELTHHHTTHHLTLDEVSLMLANALRHELDAALQRHLLHSLVHHLEHGRRDVGCEVEAVVRVLEAAVELAEMTPPRYIRGWGIAQWATLLALLEKRRGAMWHTTSTQAVALQGLSLIGHACEGAHHNQDENHFDSPRGWLHLQTDPNLLRQRALRYGYDTMERLLRVGGATALHACGADELVRLCHAARRIHDCQRTQRTDGVRWLRRRHGASFADTANEKLLGDFVVAIGDAVAPRLDSLHAHPTTLTLPQLATVFATVCALAPPHANVPTALSVAVTDALHTRRGAVDVAHVEALLHLGDHCLTSAVGGTRAVLCEVLRGLRAIPHALLHLLLSHTTSQPTRSHWVRACDLIAHTPPTASAEARLTLLRFVHVIGQPATGLLPTPQQHEPFLELRRGTLRLARELLRHEQGYVGHHLRTLLLRSMQDVPFDDDSIDTCVRALYVATALAQHDCTSQAELRHILDDILQALDAKMSTANKEKHLSPRDRSDLRDAMHALQNIEQRHHHASSVYRTL